MKVYNYKNKRDEDNKNYIDLTVSMEENLKLVLDKYNKHARHIVELSNKNE